MGEYQSLLKNYRVWGGGLQPHTLTHASTASTIHTHSPHQHWYQLSVLPVASPALVPSECSSSAFTRAKRCTIVSAVPSPALVPCDCSRETGILPWFGRIQSISSQFLSILSQFSLVSWLIPLDSA